LNLNEPPMVKTLLLITFAVISSQASINAQAKPSEASIVIHQETNLSATPQVVYETLLSSKEFSACIKKSFKDFTAANAVIDPKVGGTFSLFDGHIIGRNLELIPNQRIVQAWRVVDWPSGVYSIAKFEFKTEGSGTHLVFDHVGFPDGLKEHLATGWQQHYWDTLSKYLK